MDRPYVEIGSIYKILSKLFGYRKCNLLSYYPLDSNCQKPYVKIYIQFSLVTTVYRIITFNNKKCLLLIFAHIQKIHVSFRLNKISNKCEQRAFCNCYFSVYFSHIEDLFFKRILTICSWSFSHMIFSFK